jgi:hypothetical protein
MQPRQALDRPKMREGIKPLCCIHHSVMTATNEEATNYACHEPGCGMWWGPVREYERYMGDSSEQLLELVHCPRLGHGHMFVSGYDPETRVEVWRCSIENCAEQEEKPLRGWEPKNRYQQFRAVPSGVDRA